jgi:hypothetical protein
MGPYGRNGTVLVKAHVVVQDLVVQMQQAIERGQDRNGEGRKTGRPLLPVPDGVVDDASRPRRRTTLLHTRPTAPVEDRRRRPAGRARPSTE